LIDLQSGCAVARASRVDGGVRIEAQSEAGRMDETGSALIGADGVWSTLRTRTMKLPAAVYSGRTAWRATVPIEAADADDARLTGLWLGRNAHIVHYPVSSGKRLNIVVIIKDQWREETWNAPGDRALLEERLSDWCPQVKKMIAAADTWLKWALCGNDPSLPWHRGPMTLIGDAAHAMLPFLAQGAAMAIEDAAVLAQCLAGDRDDPARAIGYFAAARKARVQKVVATARRNGHIYHLSGPMTLARDTVMRALGGDRIMAGYDWLYGWQPVEKRPNRPNT
jgi:salicylate hydroxylase